MDIRKNGSKLRKKVSSVLKKLDKSIIMDEWWVYDRISELSEAAFVEEEDAEFAGRVRCRLVKEVKMKALRG